MSRDKKLMERVHSRSKDLTFDELERYLIMHGFLLRRSRGSHFFFGRDGRIVVICSPHGSKNNKFIARYQIDEAVKAVAEFEEENYET